MVITALRPAKDTRAEEASWPATKSLPGIFNRKSDRGGMKYNISFAIMKPLLINQLVGGHYKSLFHTIITVSQMTIEYTKHSLSFPEIEIVQYLCFLCRLRGGVGWRRRSGRVTDRMTPSLIYGRHNYWMSPDREALLVQLTQRNDNFLVKLLEYSFMISI